MRSSTFQSGNWLGLLGSGSQSSARFWRNRIQYLEDKPEFDVQLIDIEKNKNILELNLLFEMEQMYWKSPKCDSQKEISRFWVFLFCKGRRRRNFFWGVLRFGITSSSQSIFDWFYQSKKRNTLIMILEHLLLLPGNISKKQFWHWS